MSVNFGEKLRKRRLELELTLDALAAIVGTRKAYIWQLENKSPAKPSGELLIALAKALEISAEYLIDDKYSEPNDIHKRIAHARGLTESGVSDSDIEKVLNSADDIENETKNS